jgi:tryptophan synthase beta chain
MYTIGSGYTIPASHSAGLRFHGAAKLLSAMRHRDQLAATAVGQRAALEAGRTFALAELVVPAPESGHALAAAAAIASGRDADHRSRNGILVCVSGHGLLDLAAYDALRAGLPADRPADEPELVAAMAALRPVDSELMVGG